ncbi:hypothetical protein RHGRI_016367 [Rhododendron griersonianum]|uniref:Uncharacterized protein n=1 Tax=Rhododendron griersonianum TaxID=479676 RepID=A0AAV6JTZ6_9ERIC|nr:hypothetical protein RHGRI_016367 [Rhododendron griersonianum]
MRNCYGFERKRVLHFGAWVGLEEGYPLTVNWAASVSMRLPDLRRESLERFPLTGWSRLAIQTAVRLPSDVGSVNHMEKQYAFSPNKWKPAEKIPFGEIRTSETERDENVGNVSCDDEIENKCSDDRSREMRRIRIGISTIVECL